MAAPQNINFSGDSCVVSEGNGIPDTAVLPVHNTVYNVTTVYTVQYAALPAES